MSLAQLRDSLGLEHNVLVMTAAGIFTTFGIVLWSGYMPKVLEELGASGLMIGVFGTVSALLWIVFPFLGGALSDRLGRGRAMILSSALAIAGYLVYMVARSWWMFFPGMVLTTASGSFSFMGSMALTGDAVKERRRAVSMAAQGVIITLPAILAPPIGGALIQWLGLIRGVRVSLFITVILALAATLLQHRFYRMETTAAGRRPGIDVRSAWRMMRPALKSLLVASCLVQLGMGMGSRFIVLYALNVLGATALAFGFLQSLQTLTTALLVVPAAKLSGRAGQSSRRPFVAATFFLSAALPVSLILAPSASWLALPFVIFGLREVGDTVRKALIVDLAEGNSRGSVIGLYFMIIGIVVFPASFFGGWLREWSPSAPFVAGALIAGIGLLWFLWRGPK